MRPSRSIHATEPPPAPTAFTSTMGRRTGNPPTEPSKEMLKVPALIRHTSALVPPMSSVIALRRPDVRTTAAAPTAPAAGPDSAVRIGNRAAWGADIRTSERNHARHGG